MPVFSNACKQAAVTDLGRRLDGIALFSAAAAFSVSATIVRPPNPTMIRIFVRTISQGTVVVRAPASETVAAVHGRIEHATGMGCGYNNIFAVCSLLLLALAANSQDSSLQFNVKDFGAVADGVTDSTQAFQAAWNAACVADGKPGLAIPEGAYVVGPLMFKGPCKGFMVVQLRGQLLASTDLDAYSKNWIEFQYITGLLVSGGGRLDGRGASAWPHNQCPKQSHCRLLPMSLVFSFVTDATVSGISSVDSKFFHMNIFSSSNVALDSIKISAPGDSPNTDGIHIGDSTDVRITSSIIGTGDDCVSVGPGSVNVTISDVFCGPGHGISVGSLGKYPDEKGRRRPHRQELHSHRHDERAQNKDMAVGPVAVVGLRLPFRRHCHEQCAPSQVKIDRVTFQNIRGTSASPEAIKMVCSDAEPCEGVELSDISLDYNGSRDGDDQEEKVSTTTCVNVRGTSNGNSSPTPVSRRLNGIALRRGCLLRLRDDRPTSEPDDDDGSRRVIQVFVRTISPGTVVVRAPASETVAVLHGCVERATGVPRSDRPNSQDSSLQFNVKDFGAVADGVTDSTQAFQAAWNAACAAEGKPSLAILEGAYAVGPLMFKGPCKGFMVVQLRGQLLASTDLDAYSKNWIEFQYITGLLVSGDGRLDGRGASAWSHNDCPKQSHCRLLPMSLVFSFVTDATVSGISSVDSKFFHMNIFSSSNIALDSIKIRAPGDSPNTDGIHIGDSTDIRITSSIIGTGDDCVSVGPERQRDHLRRVLRAGPRDQRRKLREVSWREGRRRPHRQELHSYRHDERAQNKDMAVGAVAVVGLRLPFRRHCHEQCAPSQVKIDRVIFRNIRGTSASPEAIKMVCSDARPCEGVELSDISLDYNGSRDGDDQEEKVSTTTCVNVRGTSNGNVKPASCI
uniref:Exopolygalacturonase n=1 Tax=Ananas comosus var. bracteatus TaxID=296719 RepID=A0A6V7PK75_ANACO|nr:unnamed protein product [Ananas comosus var. bracteatus]